MKKPAPKPKKPLTERQQTYVDETMMGRSASILLGEVSDCRRSESTQRELQVQQALLSEEVGITRLDVVNGIRDAIERARVQAEPATEIAGWREIGKILGHYAPETRKVLLTDDQDRVVRKLESMTTQELLEMVERKRQIRQGVTYDGQAQTVN